MEIWKPDIRMDVRLLRRAVELITADIPAPFAIAMTSQAEKKTSKVLQRKTLLVR